MCRAPGRSRGAGAFSCTALIRRFGERRKREVDELLLLYCITHSQIRSALVPLRPPRLPDEPGHSARAAAEKVSA